MATIRPKSYTYRTGIRWKGEKRADLTSEGLPGLEVGTPPEFQGHEGIWNPEALYVASIESCIMTTFLAFAGREKLDFVSYESAAEGLLELVQKKRSFVFTRVTVRPRVVVKSEDDVAKTRDLFRTVEQRCLISNSIETEVVIEPEVGVKGG